MEVAVVTSLFPSAERPREGIFALRRWQALAARGHGVRVVHPVPFAPWLLVRGERARYRRMERATEVGGLPVVRPRYVHLPGAPLAQRNARAFAAVALRALDGGPAPEVVVADYAWPAAALAPALARRGTPFGISGRGSDVLQTAGEAGLARPLGENLAAAGHWCGVSRELVERMDELGAQPGRGLLLPNGVDRETFRPGDRGAAAGRLGWDADVQRVLCVGHLIPRKDPLGALRAFAAGAPVGAELVYVGRGELEAELAREIDALDLGGRARLAGELAPEDLGSAYRASDALLLASRREGRPNVLLEALASGLPAAARPSGGTPELLHGLPECLAADGGEQALAATLAGVLADPPAPERLAAAVQGFLWETSAELLEGWLRDAVDSGPGSSTH